MPNLNLHVRSGETLELELVAIPHTGCYLKWEGKLWLVSEVIVDADEGGVDVYIQPALPSVEAHLGGKLAAWHKKLPAKQLGDWHKAPKPLKKNRKGE